MRMESRSRSIDKLYKRRDRYEIPDWQREEVWAVDRQRKLIDTILRGWYLPKFYFLKADGGDEYYDVVDGQQRLSAIWAFYEDKLQLSAEGVAQFGGSVYSELPADVSDGFDDFEIQYDEISDATEEELAELFQRLQLGVALTPDERLNATRGKLRDFCRELAGHGFFREKASFADRRYAYFGVCVRFAYLEIEGVPPQLRFPELETLLKTYEGYPNTSPSAARMRRALDVLDIAFPNKASSLRNRSSVLALLRLAASMHEAGDSQDVAGRIGAFYGDFAKRLRIEIEKGSDARDLDLIAFQESITANLTSGKVIRTRERILRKKFLLFAPVASDLLPQGTITSAEIEDDIGGLSSEIASLIYAVNAAYGGTHGHDLFKATNETTRSLSVLGSPVVSVTDYGDFIDALYMLAYESTGSGTRYGDAEVKFVDDVRDLRTQLRHDVDHGEARKVVAKRKRMATTFRRYSGVNSPGVLPESAFPPLQARLLEEFVTLLQDIRSALQ